MSPRRPAPLPGREDKARSVRVMFDRIADRYDLLNRILTFGLDVRWRRRSVRELRLPSGSLVCDLACGTGDLCRELERAGYQAVGVDFAGRMLAKARTDAPLIQADILQLPMRSSSVDGATCGFALRNVADLEVLFTETARVVRPGGRIAFVEVAEPEIAPLRWGHAVYFRRVVPVVGGILSDRAAYRYLPASTTYLPPPAQLVDMLRRAGFPDARRVPLSTGIAQLLIGTRG